MSAVEFCDVSKSYRVGRARGIKDMLLGTRGHRARAQSVWALQDVSFTIDPGESVAILGHNGAGKSTALKLLAGTLQPTSGRVQSAGRVVPLLELGAGFHPDLTGRENIFLNASFLGMSRADTRQQLADIIDFSGLSAAIDTPVRFYSSGMYVRLGFSVAVHSRPDVLLLDEVLAVGDAEFQARCLDQFDQFRSQGRTMILVTHSREQAYAFASRALVLAGGHLAFDGPVADAPRDEASVQQSDPDQSDNAGE